MQFSYNLRKLVKSKGWTILHFLKKNNTIYYQYVESIGKLLRHIKDLVVVNLGKFKLCSRRLLSMVEMIF